MSDTRKAQGAALEAFGASEEEVAKVTGTSTRTVRNWRKNDPTYREELDRLHNVSDLELDALHLVAVRKAGLGLVEAIDASRESLHTNYADGNPNVPARMAASRELRELTKLLSDDG